MTKQIRGNLALQAGAFAGALALVWLAIAPRTPDLAAQAYRVALFQHHGFTIWDNGWYGGHHLPAYSLLFAPLAALIGMRVLGALAAVAAAACFGALAQRQWGSPARAGALWFSVAAAGDLAIGRLTYALGAAIGLGALLAARRHLAAGAVLAALTAAAAPIAGLFLALVAVAAGVAERAAWRTAAALAVPALAVASAISFVFPEGGREPFGGRAFAVALVLSAGVLVVLPRIERTLRAGVALYLLATVAAFVATTPMGDNVTRLGATVGGPLLACALVARGRRVGPPVLALIAALAVWQVYAPIRELRKGIGDPLTHASSYTGLLAFLAAHDSPVGRVEVPFTTSHWESVYVAARFPLARGWEKQLDTAYDSLFYHRERPLLASTYHAWLRSLSVRYVALPAVSLDPASKQEAALIRRGEPFLAPVWADRLWRVFEVTDAEPLAGAPATLETLGEQSFTLRFAAAGESLVQVRFSPYWRARGGCVERARGGFTAVSASRPGNVQVTIDFTLSRIFDRGRRCG